LKQLKYLKYTLAIYVYSHCNICNAISTFANIYTSETYETYVCKLCSSTCCPLPLQWTLVDAELDTSTELDATAWRLDLGCARRKPRRETRGADVSAGREHYQSGNYVRGRPCLRTDKHQFHNAFLLPFPLLFFPLLRLGTESPD
jgi:hypothetical protein